LELASKDHIEALRRDETTAFLLGKEIMPFLDLYWRCRISLNGFLWI